MVLICTYMCCFHVRYLFIDNGMPCIRKECQRDTYTYLMNALKCRTLRAMSSCHCGQTLLGGMTNGNSRNSTSTQAAYRVLVVKYTCALSTGKWPTIRMALEECWISATKQFQKKKNFDLCCPLST